MNFENLAATGYPSLPKYDPRPEEREQQLTRFREDYKFNYYYIPGYPFLEDVPQRENFSGQYWAARLGSLAGLPLNQLASTVRTHLFEPIQDVSDFDHLYAVYQRPEHAHGWLSDESFDEQRLSGCNPQAIRRLDTVPADLPFSDADVQAALGPERSLRTECERGRLYLADYWALAHIRGSTFRDRRRTIPAPRGLFAWDPKTQRLRCIGIQLRREPGARVFRPSDPGLDWLAAKLAFQCADACHQELGTHFAWTHMVMAPFAVVTRRQLALRHPVHLLLAPHFQFFLFDNELGRTTFINPGGAVDKLMGGTLSESLGIPLNLYKQWNLLESSPVRELARRGVDDPALLPRYPFRDDGLLVWHAIVEFVSKYIELYYRDGRDLAEDQELQAWAAELASGTGGRVAGMPPHIDTPAQLAEVLSLVIWACGPLHSVLNFSQWDYINVPNMSYATYAEIPEKVGAVDYATLMNILPPFDQAALQLWWCKILTSYRHDQLGHYAHNFEDPRAQLVLEAFQQRLDSIEREIIAADRNRLVSYPYFRPSRCINSINT